MTDIYADEFDDQQFGDPTPEPGGLLKEKDPEKVAKLNLKLWTSKDDLMRKREAEWEVNELRRSGVKNVQLRMESDDRSWKAWIPPHLENAPDAISAMNKAASLCRKFAALMFADPPAPQAVPTSGEDEDRDAAEFATRALTDLQSNAKLNEPKLARRAFDRASTFGSGFVRYFIHPTAGGKIPIEISASPMAQTVEDALEDPETGQPWMELTERYVRPDGTLTDVKEEAATRFIPAIKAEVLTGRNVRMIPLSAEDIWEADGVQIASFQPWGKVRKTFDLDDVSEEDEGRLFSFKPKRYKHITSPEERRARDKQPKDKDERLVFTLTTYYTACDDYPRGACVTTIGDMLTPLQRDWAETDENGNEIHLSLPLTQYKQWEEGTDDPYGFGMMDLVGEGNEIRSHMIAALMDHVDALINRKVFVPITSTLNPRDLRLPGKTIIPISGGKPEYQDIPSFPNDGMRLMDMANSEMENDTGLGQVAQGLESAQVQSGRHAQAILSQVHSGLSDIRQNIEDAYVRASMIELELIRAFYDQPRRIGYVGEDGAYKERRWTGAEMRSTTDVRLKPGTLSMLSPIQKAALAQQYAQFGVITQEDLRDVTASELGGTLGLQDDPFVLRIRRQIAAFLEGPPAGWQPETEQVPVTDPQTGQPIPDPQTGEPMMQEQQIMDPVLQGIFRPYPIDDLPYVARTRLREIGKTMSKSEFAVLPPEWQFGLVTEFQRAQAAQQQAPGQQVGQPPNVAQSPAQRTQGPLAPPDTPVPTGVGPGTLGDLGGEA